MIAIENRGSRWEQVDYRIVVWECDTTTGATSYTHQGIPEGYYPGLFQCYVDGVSVDTHRFDQELERHAPGWTRDSIQKAVYR